LFFPAGRLRAKQKALKATSFFPYVLE